MSRQKRFRTQFLTRRLDPIPATAKRHAAIAIIAGALKALGRDALALEFVSDPDALIAEIAKTNPRLATLLQDTPRQT